MTIRLAWQRSPIDNGRWMMFVYIDGQPSSMLVFDRRDAERFRELLRHGADETGDVINEDGWTDEP